MNLLVAFLCFCGAFVLASKAMDFVKNVVNRFFVPSKHPLSYGKAVLITGATDGIGKSLAVELAKKGCNLVLISRTLSKLEATKKELLEVNSEISIDILAVDYSTFSTSSDSFEEVKKFLNQKGSQIGVLINNVGMSYPFPQFFHELSNQQVSDLISLNVTSTTLMTKLYVNARLESAAKSLVVNIGSFAGVFPSPLLAEYSAAKAYIETLTRSLSVEYETKGIEFQCHVPLYIVSKMSKIRKGSLMVPTSQEYANMVISNFGKGVVVSPHLIQSFVTELMKHLPYSALMSQVKKLHLGIRTKALRKQERQKKE